MQTDDKDEQDREDADFHMAVRDTAYFLWVQAGRPEGQPDRFWEQAVEQHLRARAYSIWLRKGRPSGHSDEDWDQARQEVPDL